MVSRSLQWVNLAIPMWTSMNIQPAHLYSQNIRMASTPYFDLCMETSFLLFSSSGSGNEWSFMEIFIEVFMSRFFYSQWSTRKTHLWGQHHQAAVQHSDHELSFALTPCSSACGYVKLHSFIVLRPMCSRLNLRHSYRYALTLSSHCSTSIQSTF